jgi:hypothetical protein
MGGVPVSVDDHLNNVPPAVRPILAAARKTIRSAAPSADEVAYQSKPPKSGSAMYKLARYLVNGEEVAGLGTFAKHSTIYFYRGRELDDEAGLLPGSGMDTRFVTLRNVADAEKPAVKKLVREAFELGGQGSTV